MAISEVGTANAGGTGTAISLTHNLTIAADDIIVVALHTNDTSTQTDNNGATPFTDVYGTFLPGNCSNSHIWVRKAGASEPAAYAFTQSDASASYSIIARVFRGCHADIWDVAPAAARTATGTSATATAPDMTITNAGSMGLLGIFVDSSSVTLSDPTNSYGGEVEIGNRALATYIRAGLAAGATGTTAATLSFSDDWAAYQFALKPAAAGSPYGSSYYYRMNQ